MEVSAEVINNRVSLFEVFVGPSGKGNYNYNLVQFIANYLNLIYNLPGEGILLNSLPFGVNFRESFCVGHGNLPLKGVVRVYGKNIFLVIFNLSKT